MYERHFPEGGWLTKIHHCYSAHADCKWTVNKQTFYCYPLVVYNWKSRVLTDHTMQESIIMRLPFLYCIYISNHIYVQKQQIQTQKNTPTPPGCVFCFFVPQLSIPGYPSEYLLTITDPTASNTGVGAKFSEAIKFTQRRCLRKTGGCNVNQTRPWHSILVGW